MDEGKSQSVAYDGFVTEKVEEKTQRQVIYSIAWFGIVISVAYASLFLLLSFHLLMLQTLFFAVTYVVVCLLSVRPRVSIRPLGVAFMVAALLHTSSLGLIFLPASTGMHLWGLVVPFFCLISIDRRELVWSILSSVLATGVLVFMEWGRESYVPPLQVDVADRVLPLIRAVTILGIVLFVTGIFWVYHRRLEVAQQALRRSYEQSEALLLNILPASIAERLKSHTGIIADDIHDASVLFCDLVGFTQLASSQSALQTVEMLNGVFVAFDEAIAARGLEKIKTIGDAYMVASGVPNRRADHAREIILLAEDFLQIVEQYNAERGCDLSLRIGVNCGPMTAGIIGKHKFAYDIWGDTVNVASRMESSGVPGRIQVTEIFVEATRGAFRFEPREDVVIKGVGQMTTYLYVGPD